VAAFYALAVLISWIGWLPLVLSRTGIGLLPFDVPMPWTIVGTLGPPLAGIIMWRGEPGGVQLAVTQLLRPSWRSVAGTAAGILVIAVTFVGGTAFLLTISPPNGWDIGALSLYGFHWLTTLLGGPIFEEWGWRGYAQRRLQEAFTPSSAALIVGVGWGLWHLPLFLVPSWSSASIPSYVAMVTALSFLMAWGFNMSRGWIVSCILMHFTYNASSRVLGDFLGGANLRPWPDPVTAILLAFASAACVVVVLTRGRLGASTPQN
jgi:membrane protease YdiL (CAAX protease family)